jgi:hypothetical protein
MTASSSRRSEQESANCETTEFSGFAWSLVWQSSSSFVLRPDFRRFLEEFKESLTVLDKTAFINFESFLQIIGSARMASTPHLHVSMPHVEELADFLVLPPILPLTSLGTIQGGLAYSAVLELEIRRFFGSADDAAPEGHDCCWSGLRLVE